MKKPYLLQSAIMISMILFTSLWVWAVPPYVNFQGRLSDMNDMPVDSPGLTMKFRIFDAKEGGTLLWEEKQTVVVSNGIYNVILGAGLTAEGSFDPDLFSESSRWIETEVDTEIMLPRIPVFSTPYALHAGVAENINGIMNNDIALISNLSNSGGPVVHWNNLSSVPAILHDESIDWDEIGNKPLDFADGIDNVGLTSETDPQVGNNRTHYVPKWDGSSLCYGSIYDSGNVGIGTAEPEAKLHVNGDLKVAGAIIGDVHVSQITGLLGSGYSYHFPDVIDNLVNMEIAGVLINDPVVIISGPGCDIETIPGFDALGRPLDTPGLSMEHPLIFETSIADAPAVKSYFDSYEPGVSWKRDFAIIIKHADGTENFRWNGFGFAPDGYEPGIDGRTRFTLTQDAYPDNTLLYQLGDSDTSGNSLSFNPETDKRVEIQGVSTAYPAVEIDEENNLLTFTYDFVEAIGIFDWVRQIVKSQDSKRSISIIEESGGVEVSRRNYYECFPVKFEQFDLGNVLKVKTRVVLTYSFAENAN